MIEGVLRLGERRIGAVMTPRVHVVWIDVRETAEEIYHKVIDSHHSRFPVARGSLENVEGIVLAKDLLAQHLKGEPLDLRPLLRESLFIPETMPALRVLELFKEKGTHMAMVIGEYGGVEGLVTPNDILEDIVGHVAFAGAPAEPQAVQREDGSWLLDGLLPIDRLEEIFDLAELPEEESGAYQTMGGFVIHQLGAIPTTGQSLEWNDLRSSRGHGRTPRGKSLCREERCRLRNGYFPWRRMGDRRAKADSKHSDLTSFRDPLILSRDSRRPLPPLLATRYSRAYSPAAEP